MRTLAEFRSLHSGTGLSNKEVRLLYRSLRRMLFLWINFHSQKKFQSDLNSEIEFQKTVYGRIRKDSPLLVRKFLSEILLDELKFHDKKFRGASDPRKKRRILLEKRTKRYEDFLKFSLSDRRRFEKVGARFERRREKVISHATKKGWAIGFGVVGVFLAGIAATIAYEELNKGEKK